MPSPVVRQTLHEREKSNERHLAIVRTVFLSLSALLDTLTYFRVIQVSTSVTSWFTLFMDGLFLTFAVTILTLLLRKVFFPGLKFIVITLDYVFITVMLAFDPSVPRDGGVISWVAMLATLFLFSLNLLRFSRAATLYATFLSIVQFVVISLWFGTARPEDYVQYILVLSVFFTVGYSVTASNRRMMAEVVTKQMMERYLSPQLVGELFTQQFSLEPGGKSQRVTVLFSDIRSFTTLAESLPASQVVELLNAYLSRMTDVIFAHRGTLDKFVGDAIMTVFGTPVPQADDVQRALRTALAMRVALRGFNDERRPLGQTLQIGIGLHTGDVIAGNIGSERRLDFTVIGDSVNLCSRIEGLTKVYGCPILVSQSVYDELVERPAGSDYLLRYIDTVTVKGKTLSVRIYEVLEVESEQQAEEQGRRKRVYEAGVDAMAAGNAAAARALFEQLPGDGPSEYRLRQLTPPSPQS